MHVLASGSIIKNAKSVVVPHTGGLKGIEAAAAAGIVAGRADRKLEVIADVSADELAEIRDFLDRVPIEVGRAEDGPDFDLTVYVECAPGEGEAGAADSACVRIADYHTNIVREERNGQVLHAA